MKIAVITLFCREHFRLEAWRRYYQEYRDEVHLHVIVNNGDKEDSALLQESFPGSTVLWSPTSNMMASYNLALREVLLHPEVDAVAQIVNDVRLSPGALGVLYAYLYSDPALAMVSPVLLRKDSDVIDSFGCSINPRNLDFVLNDSGRTLSEIGVKEVGATGLPGGAFLAKRALYERFGIQDESLMMYADEIDMGIRVERLGYRMGATSRACAWHQHVNRDGKAARNPQAAYLMGRNAVYIARKYGPRSRVVRVFFRRVYCGLDEIRSAVMHGKEMGFYRFGWAMVRGAFAGLRMS